MQHDVVYFMECKVTGRGYVGSTTNLSRRKMDHRARLVKSAHWNPDVQSAYDAHGWRNFQFIVLEAVIDGDLIGAENRWIKKLGGRAYNRRSAAMRSPETGAKISAALTGKKHSAERRALNSKGHIGNTSAKGSKRSEEMKNAQGRPVVVTDPDGKSTTYPRISLAAEAIGYQRANMFRVLRSGGTVKRGPMRGWKFEYAP